MHFGSFCVAIISIFNEIICKWGQRSARKFFGYCLPSARMVIESAFGRLKARFGSLRGEMILN